MVTRSLTYLPLSEFFVPFGSFFDLFQMMFGNKLKVDPQNISE